MRLFDVGSGSDTLKPCPQCHEDKIKRTGWTNRTHKYTCTSCGYEASSEEVQVTPSEILHDLKGDLKNLGESNEDWDDIKHPVRNIQKKVNNKERQKIKNIELREQVEERQLEGWSIDKIDNENERVIMSQSEGGTIGGHALTGIFTGLWTFGAGNVVYEKLSKAKNKEKIVVKINDNSENDENSPEHIEDLSNQIRTLKELHEDDIISDEELSKKKKQLLEKM